MAITDLALQTILRTGLNEPTFSAANADGHDVANSGRMFLYVKNADASPMNVTITTPGNVDNLAITDQVVAVAAGEEEVIGPFPPAIYNADPGTDDTIEVLFSSVTSLTIAAFLLPVA